MGFTRSDSTAAPFGTPVDGDHEVPKPTDRLTCPPSGLQTKREPSAAAATVPPPVTPPGSALAWNQLAPPSVEKATRFTEGFAERSTLPDLTITLGFFSA